MATSAAHCDRPPRCEFRPSRLHLAAASTAATLVEVERRDQHPRLPRARLPDRMRPAKAFQTVVVRLIPTRDVSAHVFTFPTPALQLQGIP